MKIIFIVVMILLLCLPLNAPAMASESTIFISKDLAVNEEIFRSNTETAINSVITDEINISISQDLRIADISLVLDGHDYEATLQGEVVKIHVENIVGYSGEYEGFLIPTASADSLAILPIIADVTFTQDQIFAALTIGTASENSNPIIKFYGDLSEKLSKVATKNSEIKIQQMNNQETYMDDNIIRPVPAAAYDTSVKYQARNSVILDGYDCGRISIFHPDYVSSSGVAPIHVKANTNSSGVLDYLHQSLGYDDVNNGYALTPHPDRFEITLTGKHEYFCNIPNSFVPQNSETHFPIIIPFYLGQTAGIQTITVNCVTSSTVVTTDKYNDASNLPNKITWDISRIGGWESNEYDGDYCSETGMSVQAAFSINGNIQNNMTELIGASMRIRYEYFMQSPTATVAMNIYTDCVELDSAITFVPLD